MSNIRSGLNIVTQARQRVGVVVAAIGVSAAMCLCGALVAFVFAPGQAIKAFQISRIPLMDAASVAAAEPGDTVLITGILSDNAPVRHDLPYVAFTDEEWVVTVTEASDEDAASSNGRWENRESSVPALNLSVDDQTLVLQASGQVELSGPLHEQILNGDGLDTADFRGQPLPAGSHRIRGLNDDDLVTVLGTRAAAGGVLPEQLFAGDRVAFEESERGEASGLLFAGLCMMALAPLAMVGGLAAALFGRRR